MASKGVAPLPRMRGSALAHGCDRDGRVVLPLARAAAVSTGWSVRVRRVDARCLCEAQPCLPMHAQLAFQHRLRVRQVHVAWARAPPAHEELPCQPHVARPRLQG